MTGLSDDQSDRSVYHLHLQWEDCHGNINTFRIIVYHNSGGRARLVGFEERDRDCCFRSVTVRVDMPRLKQTATLNFSYKSKEAAE